VTGLGLGLSMPPSLNAAMSVLAPERSGVGNAVLQALRQVGGAIGVAVLGAVLNAGYRDRLPGQAPGAVRDSVSSGVVVASRLSDASLLGSVRAAFVHGMDMSLAVAGSVALVGAVLAVFMLPRRPIAAPPAGDPVPVLAESGI
jgi:DHA2 family multidrug resistance protein-like MFS transporter